VFRELLMGIAGGTLSGILPGIHVNTLAALVSRLGVGDNLVLLAMGLTHTFLDVVPSAFLGVPDEGTALGVLPAHRLVLDGRAMEVVRIALWSSLLAIVMTVPLLPIYLRLAPLYRPSVGRLAVLFLAAMIIFTETGMRKLHALAIFLLSGILGILTFRLELSQPFYHLFTGLFGIPVILTSLHRRSHPPLEPGGADVLMEGWRFGLFSLLGTVLGMAASLVPAFTSSQAALIGSFLSRDERSFLTVVFSVNTANFIFSLVNFFSTGRVRNGIVALMHPHSVGLGTLVMASLFVGLAVTLYGEPLAEAVLMLLRGIPYRPLNAAVLVFLVVLSLIFDGFSGLLVLLGASLVGLLAVILGVKRTNCMGVLMLGIIIG